MEYLDLYHAFSVLCLVCCCARRLPSLSLSPPKSDRVFLQVWKEFWNSERKRDFAFSEFIAS